jgi:putative ABC transport system permease protein
VRAVVRAARGGLGGRRLQAVIIGLVVLAATAASTLAVGLLAGAHSPFDHAFAAQRGAEVTATADLTAATRAQLAATSRLPGVTAAGPFSVAAVTAQVTVPGVRGSFTLPLQIAGRSGPGGAVDKITLDAGHWPRTAGEIVIGRRTEGSLGGTVTVGGHTLIVTGIADSVTRTAQAWVLPPALPALAGPAGIHQAQMLYRFAGASTGNAHAISAGLARVRAALPRGALLSTVSYLGVRQAEQASVAPWVPFIVAFGVIALVISVLIVLNVVGGAVLAGTTRIGVLKSVGFTPAQVTASYVLLVLVPAMLGTLAGVVCGNLLAIPLLAANAQVYGIGVLGVPFWADATVPLAVLALTVAGAVPPAARAGRMSATAAIATGRAPRPAHGYLAHRALARLTALPRAVTLGLATPAARPARTLVTVAAIVAGAASVTFGTGLAASLNRAYTDISQAGALPVEVSAIPQAPAGGQPSAGGGQPEVTVGSGGMTLAQQRTVAAALAAQPGTRHVLAVTSDQLTLPGLSDTVAISAYRGNPAWSGLALISGHWYSGAAGVPEVVANTLFLTETGTSVGSDFTLTSGGHRITVRIAGEVFQPGREIVLYTTPAVLAAVDPAATPQQYLVALRPGTRPQAYGNAVSAALGAGYESSTISSGGRELQAVLTLVAMLTALIIAVAGLGVLNTVALQVRERAHSIGVLKAVGMTPRQALAMTVCSVALAGLAAGIVAVPAGILLHHSVLPVMAHGANSGLPPSLLSVYTPAEAVLLALAGLGIAVAGALGPAAWAARARTVTALRAE